MRKKRILEIIMVLFAVPVCGDLQPLPHKPVIHNLGNARSIEGDRRPDVARLRERKQAEKEGEIKYTTEIPSRSSTPSRHGVVPRSLNELNERDHMSSHGLERRQSKVLHTEQEKIIHRRKLSHEKMTEEERIVKRRKYVQGSEQCEDDSCAISGLQVSLKDGFGMTYCQNCPDAHYTGSLIRTWEAHHGPRKFHVDGLLVLAVPNNAENAILNQHQVNQKVVLVDRGGIPMARKVKYIQESGGVAAVIIDNGGCSSNLNCGMLGYRDNPDRFGFARLDNAEEWDEVYIPTVLISQQDGAKLKKLMDLEKMFIPGFGDHFIIRED